MMMLHVCAAHQILLELTCGNLPQVLPEVLALLAQVLSRALQSGVSSFNFRGADARKEELSLV